MPDTALHPLRRALTKFWAPVPWMLEAAIVLEIVLGKYVEAGIIAVLLAFNAGLGFVQEGRAKATGAELNSVAKKVVQVLFLAVGLVMTGHAILTPLLMVIIMLTGDLLGMSMTADNVRPSPTPNAWRIGKLTITGVSRGLSERCFALPSWSSPKIPRALESKR